jgi:predicted pyridoxine 5'-phosphate oxidase superfamily flavin-nucleotide-binding protein
MNITTLTRSLSLAQKVKHIIIATVGDDGVPHVATAERLRRTERDDLVILTAWFCPQTVINLDKRPQISIVIWDNREELGFQLLGEVELIENIAILNGYIPEEVEPPPQEERQLLVCVHKILNFSHAPHKDTEIL